MKTSEIAIAVIKEGIIKPTFASAYTFLDAWSYLLFGQNLERLNTRGVGVYEYKSIRPSYVTGSWLRYHEARRKNNVDEER